MNLNNKFVAGFFLLAGVIVVSGFLGQHKMAPIPSPKYVAVVKVTPGNLERFVDISAELRPYLEIDLHSKVAGYLKYISVDIGDPVKAGEIIAQVETPELKADYDNTMAAYEDAKLEFDRLYGVSKTHPGLLAQQDIDNAQAAYAIAKAKMQRAKTLMDYSTITVPFDGVVVKRYADPGAMIQNSDQNGRQTMPVVRIAQIDRLRLDFPVPESDVPFIKVGMPMEVVISATGQKMMGKVARTTDMVDPETRTMETEVDLDNHDKQLTPGMYADVKLPLENKKNVLTLPIQAVSLTGEHPNVWKINPLGEIQETPIDIGLQTANSVEILNGLNKGDEVVFGSRELVNVGMKVTPKLMGESQES